MLLTSPVGELEYLIAGSGTPVTVLAHGLGGSIAQTRPLAGGVPGTRAFLHFPGHGASVHPAQPPTIAELASALDAVAGEVAATRAVGVSLGATALLHLLAGRPDRFERVVFFLPAAVDRVRSAASRAILSEMAAAIDAGTVEDVVRKEIPVAVRDTRAAREYVRDRAAALAGLAPTVRAAAAEVAVTDRAALARVRVPALVIGAVGDPLHEAAVARELAATLPRARLHVFDEPGPLWTRRAELRALIGGFLS